MHPRPTRLSLAVGAAACLLAAGPAPALINADFTPVELLKGAKLICLLKLAAPDKDGKVAVQVTATLVGKAPARPLAIDVTSGPKKAHLEMIRKMMAASGAGPAVLVDGVDEKGEDAAWLHLAGRWVDLYTEDHKLFEADQINSHMEGTWAGSTDMLIRCLRYVQQAADPEVPVNTGCEWAEKIDLARVGGKVHAATAVDLAGDGTWALHLAAAGGDRLFVYDKAANAFRDVAAARKLAARSAAATWADFNADGRADLAEWDGKRLAVWLAGKGGAFSAGRAVKTGPLKAGCLGLAALDVGVKARPGMLLSAAAAPVLLVPDGQGGFAARALDFGAADLKKLGPAGACLVADLNGDGLADVLQPFAKGGLIYRGAGAGRFAPARPIAVAGGEAPFGGCLGDFDGDGLLDVFFAATDRCRLWHNLGKMGFADRLGVSGEIAYISQPFGIGGQSCDVNADGRQDVLVVYADRSPHIFFNRGFRSFGHSHLLDLDQKGLLAAAAKGLQAACVADLTGDGAQDLALVAAGGEVCVFPRDLVSMAPPACVRAALPLGGACAGPVTVTGWAGKRCLGAWNVRPALCEALFGCGDADEVLLKWQLPGQKPRQRTVKAKPPRPRVTIGPR